MNKKELIRKYEELWKEHSPFHEPVPYTSMVELFLKELKLLDEPEKVKVPQFVTDVIESAREHSPELEDALHYTWGNGTKEFTEWYKKKSNRDLFARAWLDGYEVETEKRYIVKVKAAKCNTRILVFGELSGSWFFAEGKYGNVIVKHTRKELEEANFGWVFDCEGIQIEEVEK